MNYEYTNDKQYAYDVCREHGPAVKLMHAEYSGKCLSAANKFVNKPDTEWIIDSDKDQRDIKISDSYQVKYTDDVADTYTWLVKLLISRSCKYSKINPEYKGSQHVKFSTYMISLINNHFTFKEWLKWKYGSTEYIPTPIKKLGKDYWQVFKMLRRKKTIEVIASEIQKSREETEEIINEIRNILSDNNIIDMIQSPLITSLYIEMDNEIHEIDTKDTDDNNPDLINEASNVSNVIKKSIDGLAVWDRRLLKMYWANNMSASSITKFIKSDGKKMNLDKLNIKKDKDISPNIARIIRGLNQHIKDNYKDFFLDYNPNERTLRYVVKTFLENFEKNDFSLPLIKGS